jgi:probable rRNA maturation factor
MPKNNYKIFIQRACTIKPLPKNLDFKHWATAALKNKIAAGEVTIRIVDPDEIIALNTEYRKKNYATNVLSFPFDMPNEITTEPAILGDIVICAAVIIAEAKAQQKTVTAHWAHMVVHGILHLLGYDHEQDDQALHMETLEIDILNSLGFPNPYLVIGDA